jgi:hypothetical protein
MILDSTAKSIQVVLSSSVAANQLPITTSWADISTTAFTPGSANTQTNNSTVVSIVAAPAASVQRQVKNISIYNADSATATIFVSLNDGGTVRTMVKVSLQAGYSLLFSDGGWQVTDTNGSQQLASSVNAAGANGQIQYNNGGTALGASANFTWNSSTNNMVLGGSAPGVQVATTAGTPTAPASGSVSLFGRQIAGRQLAAQIGPNGLDSELQPLLARNKVGIWMPPGNATTVPGVLGITAPTVVGTATARTVATTNMATRMRRLGYVSSSVAGSLAEARVAAAQFSASSGSNDGSGFFMVMRWVPSDAAAVSGERNFIGMMNSTAAATNVEPSTLTNAIGVAQLSTDATQLYVVYGGSAAQASIALGTSFPGATLSNTVYELALYAPSGVANTFYYQVTNVTSSVTASGTLTGTAAQIPQSSTLLAPRAWATNNATALAVGFDLCSIYVETDN